MRKSDYLLRIIEEATAVLARAVGLRQSKQYQDALQSTNEAFRRNIGLTSAEAVRMAPEALINELRLQDDLGWVENGQYLAALMYEEGQNYLAQQHLEPGYQRLLQALEISLIVCLQSNLDWLDLLPTPAQLHQELTPVSLPNTSLAYLLLYYESRGRFAQAENVLFYWLETHPTSAEPLQLGMAFYGRLQQKSDDDLLAGSLPRAEVSAGQQEIAALIES